MGRRPKSRPSFFKFVITHSTTNLKLPRAFVDKYGAILPEKAKLRARSGETWKVKLVRIGDEYRFKRGWTKFVKDVGLKMGELVVFWFNIDTSTFDVVVCGTNGCERQICGKNGHSPVGANSDSDEDVKLIKDGPEVNNDQPSRPNVVENEAGSDDNNEKETHDRTSEEAHPNFKITLKEHQNSRLTVRKGFALAAGLVNKKAVVLQCPPKQRVWPVLLAQNQNLSQFRLDMSAGWSEFRRKNGLVYGKMYSFEYIPDKNVIEVKLIN